MLKYIIIFAVFYVVGLLVGCGVPSCPGGRVVIDRHTERLQPACVHETDGGREYVEFKH